MDRGTTSSDHTVPATPTPAARRGAPSKHVHRTPRIRNRQNPYAASQRTQADGASRRGGYLTIPVPQFVSKAWDTVTGTVTGTAKWFIPSAVSGWFSGATAKQAPLQSMLDFQLMPRRVGETPAYVKEAQQKAHQEKLQKELTEQDKAPVTVAKDKDNRMEYLALKQRIEELERARDFANVRYTTLKASESKATKEDEEILFYVSELGPLIDSEITRLSTAMEPRKDFYFGSRQQSDKYRKLLIAQQGWIKSQREVIVEARSNDRFYLKYNDANTVNAYFRKLQKSPIDTDAQVLQLIHEQERIIDLQRWIISQAHLWDKYNDSTFELSRQRYEKAKKYAGLELGFATKDPLGRVLWKEGVSKHIDLEKAALIESEMAPSGLTRLPKAPEDSQNLLTPNKDCSMIYESGSDESPLAIDLSDDDQLPALQPLKSMNLQNGQAKRANKPQYAMRGARPSQKVGGLGSPSNPRISGPTPKKLRPAEEFLRNFGNVYDDPQKIEYLEKVWGISIQYLQKELSRGRLPFMHIRDRMLDMNAYLKKGIMRRNPLYTDKEIKTLAKILGDGGFLARNHITVINPFKEFPGTRVGDHRRNGAEKVYIANEWDEPPPRPVVFKPTKGFDFEQTKQALKQGTTARNKMKKHWNNETRYDWVFRSPADPTPEDQRELADYGIEWEIDYFDPRIRTVPWDDSRDTFRQQASRRFTRAKYSVQDSLRYKLIEEIKKINWDLGRRYERMDLERKRNQVPNEDWRVVQLVVGKPDKHLKFAKHVEVQYLDGELDAAPMKQPNDEDSPAPQIGSKRRLDSDYDKNVKVPKPILSNPDERPIKKTKTSASTTYYPNDNKSATVDDSSSYQKSLRDVPKEWRKSHSSTFSAWTQDMEDLGVFLEIDLDGDKLPKDIGSWEKEFAAATAEGKRPTVTIVKGDDETEVMEVWDLDGTIKPLGWTDPNAKPEEIVSEAAKKEKEPAAKDKASPEAAKSPENIFEVKKSQPYSIGSPAKSPRAFKTTAPSSPFGGRTGVAKDADDKPTAPLSPPSSADEDEGDKEEIPPTPGSQAEERLTSLFQPPSAADLAAFAMPSSPALKRSSSDMSNRGLRSPAFLKTVPKEADGVKLPTPTSATATVFQPLSQSSANSSQQPVSIFSSFASAASDTTAGSGGVATSQGQDENAAPSEESENNVLRPLSNGTRQNSVDGSKSKQPGASLLPSPMPSSSAAPLSGITAAEMGMFGNNKPSPGDKRPAMDDDFGMELDNTPQSAKRFRSPRNLMGNENAATSIGETYKPIFSTNFDFGAVGASKPEPFKFGTPTPAASSNAGSSSPFVFGAAATTTTATETPKAAEPSGSLFKFGGAAPKPAEPAPFKFGDQPASKPAAPASSSVFNFGQTAVGTSTTAASAPTLAPQTTSSLFGSAATATTGALFSFGAASPAPSAAAPPPIFNAPSPLPPSQPLFGAAVSKPSEPFSFGAATTSAPSTQPLFGAQPPTVTAPSTASSFTFGTTATTSAPVATTGFSTAPVSSSFTFGSTANAAPKPAAPTIFGAAATTAPEAPKAFSASFGGNSPAPTAPAGSFDFGFGGGSTLKPAVNTGFSFGVASPQPGSPAPTPAAIFGGGGTADAGAAGSFDFGFQPTPGKPAGGTLGRNIKAPVSRLKKGGSLRR